MVTWRYALVALTLAACEPEVGSGAYYCGPERACPPDLRCDESTAVCRYPAEVQPFVCAEGANDHEPDDSLATAADLGAAGCGIRAIALEGCVDNAADLDHLAIHASDGCTTHLVVQAPIGLAGLAVDVLGPDGAVAAAATVCDDLDAGGLVHLCADLAPGDYVVRVGLGPEEDGTCDGDCAYNRYHLSIQ